MGGFHETDFFARRHCCSEYSRGGAFCRSRPGPNCAADGGLFPGRSRCREVSGGFGAPWLAGTCQIHASSSGINDARYQVQVSGSSFPFSFLLLPEFSRRRPSRSPLPPTRGGPPTSLHELAGSPYEPGPAGPKRQQRKQPRKVAKRRIYSARRLRSRLIVTQEEGC